MIPFLYNNSWPDNNHYQAIFFVYIMKSEIAVHKGRIHN